MNVPIIKNMPPLGPGLLFGANFLDLVLWALLFFAVHCLLNWKHSGSLARRACEHGVEGEATPTGSGRKSGSPRLTLPGGLRCAGLGADGSFGSVGFLGTPGFLSL